MKSSSTIAAAQGLLIRIARIAWTMYASFVAKFTAFNAIYTESYGADALKEIEATAVLPTEANIVAKMTALLNVAKTAASVCTAYWQNLSVYIEATFDAADWEAAKKEAGSALYQRASGGNWTDLMKMLEQSLLFITDNLDKLSKDGKGMPATFPDVFTAAKASLDKALQAYSIGRQNAKLQTAARRQAYKNVHARLMSMLKVAKQVFKNDAETKLTFTFAAIKRSFSPEKTAICLTIKDADKMPVTTSHLRIQSGKVSAEADANANGIISLKIAPGVYTCTITTPGCDTKIITGVKVLSGGTKRIKVIVVKAAAITPGVITQSMAQAQ